MLGFGLLFWSFGCFFGWSLRSFFLWLVLAKLLWVASLAALVASSLLNPSWKVDFLLAQDADDARSWLSAVLEIELNLFLVDSGFFGVWVKATHVRNNTTTTWVAA